MVFQAFHNGINLGGWLSQYEFAALSPLTAKNLEIHFDSFITEGDIRQIASWGFDHVRLPVSGYLLYDQISRTLNEQPLTYIKKCIGWCQAYHLNMVLDLHDFYGNVYGAMDTPMPLLTNPALQEHFLIFWTALSRQLKKYGKRDHNDDSNGDDIVIAFELLNEVSDASHYLWNQLYKSAIKEIRKTDSTRLILVGSNCQNSVAYLNQLDLIDDPAVFYNFHYYEPQVFTHQKAHFSEEMKDFNQAVTYPGDISNFRKYLKHHPEYLMKYSLVADETSNDRMLMERLLKSAIDFAKYSGHSLYCGEFGVIDSAPQAEAVKWTKDLLAILDANHIGHALWNYKALDFGLLDLEGNIMSGSENSLPLFILSTQKGF
jgi:endoglucanase|nr:cellulase family glycosylhydrolase [uncultured Schaedlerella sp.]